jgi:UDP-N-acetylmuramoyl-tripeptide--D-alanyl-D-alanine ligase
MQLKKINPIIQWWVTPKLPYHDIFELPLLINKSKFAQYHQIFSQWVIHPIKRRMARLYLKILQATTNIKVIGITGSAGKTTTKEMLYSILKLEAPTVCTRTFIDPVYNIPNTILKTPPGTKYLILEMGVEYPNEMDYYLWLAKPDVGVITNIFPTHLEFLEDINGVLKEKSKLVMSLNKNDTAILNSNDQLLKTLKPKSKIIWFQNSGNPIERNASAARAVAESLEISDRVITKGLASYESPVHRLSLIRLKNGAFVLDDTYNSNPEALSSTLKYFVNIAGKNKKIAVLGDMKELGGYEEKLHRKIGKEISSLGFSAVIGVGKPIKYLIEEVGKNAKTLVVAKQEDVMQYLKPYLQKGSYILIKGSRSIGLDKLVDKLV